jgi:glucose-1-phosphatase
LSSNTLIRAVIWDMGGVLIRTEDQAPRLRLAKRFGLTPAELNRLVFDSQESIRATLGEFPEEAVWEYVAKSLDLTATGLAEFMLEFWSGDASDADLYRFIKELRTSYKTGLLSNAWSNARTVVENRYHVLDAFDVVIFSAEVGLAKPDSRIYQLELDKLGVQATQAIFVDDVQENIDAANLLGIHGVRFENSWQARQAVMHILSEGELPSQVR